MTLFFPSFFFADKPLPPNAQQWMWFANKHTTHRWMKLSRRPHTIFITPIFRPGLSLICWLSLGFPSLTVCVRSPSQRLFGKRLRPLISGAAQRCVAFSVYCVYSSCLCRLLPVVATLRQTAPWLVRATGEGQTPDWITTCMFTSESMSCCLQGAF